MVIKALAVNGERQSISPDAPSAYPGLTHKSSIALSDTVRGHAMPEPIALDPGDLVELQFEDGIKWLGPCDMLEDLFPEGMQRKRAGEDVFEVTGHLEHPEATRGLGKAVLKVLNVFAKKTSMALAKPAIKELAQKIERKIWGMEAGLWSVRDNLNFVPLEALDTNVPILLLLHGTGSSAQSSFEKLPGTPLWKYWQETYGLNIVAFQHETLSKSPLENAVDLLGQLPANATLHLVSHSRGGLVGEVLSRFSKIDMAPTEGFTDADIQLLNDAGQANDAQAIGHLRELANKKQFKVEKFIRVACPAAGTTLLSKRLDYFVNIVLNLVGAATGAATNPLYEAFKELLVAVVDQKNDPDVLPGLEAMKPSSLFIQLLNNRADSSIPIAVPVSVISGNCKVGLRLNSLLVIASKLFFWEDNDLIVDTRSMYWGAKKTNGLQYFLDEGSAVNHFHYFKNEKTQTAILDAFKATGSAPIKGFRPWQEGNWGDAQRNAALGLEGGQFFMDNPSGKKPILVLLPGIMGSNIKQGGDLIWINYLRFITGGLRRIGIHAKDIAVPSIVATSYKELARSLGTEYDVVTFPYDWRQSMVVSAGLLDKKINQLLTYNQPIKIIGHSMGGVLMRDFILYHGKTWQKLNARKDFRLLFLGAPLGGSYRILRVLLGQDELIKKLALVDVVHGIKGLLEIFTQFPGILSLLPLTKDGDNDFADSKVWKQMAMYLGNEQWPIPDTIPGNNAGEKKLLQAFAEYRNKVVDEQPHIDFKNAVYVAGRGKFTTCGYRKDQTVRGKELTFLATAEGDQSVTWNSGIPANMDKQQVYYVNVPHGSLASTPSMFAGIRELLSKGETNLFSRNRPVVRSTEKLFKQPDTLNFDLTPRGLENTLLGISETKAMTVGELPIKVRVAHGHLKYAAYPLLAGHFKNDSILYAEKAINEKLQGLLAERHAINLYPGDIGTSEILLTQTQQVDDFAGAIIVGLGEPGTLNSHGLRLTVEQAVARYLLMINGRDKLKTPLQHKTPLGISSLIIGCGYGGLSIENSIGAIIEGVVNANAKIKGLYQENAKWIERIQFVELYEDRLLSCCYALQDLCSQEGGLLNIEREQEGVEKLWGSRKRINLLMNEEWWNRIVVRTGEQRKGTAKSMNFVLGNNRARQDERDVFTTTGIIEKLAKVISTDNRWDNEKARALYQLLVPNDFKDEVKKYGNIVWVLDNYTAGFPWELLHDRASGAKPLCIGSGMIRQLISSKGRTKIETVSTKTALVVGDPNLKGYITQLSGALAEASAVASLLKENQYETKELLRKSSEEIIPALLGADYKIIHLAGHGEFNEDNPVKESGMVIGNNEYLTTAEIAQIGASSDLVFVNCCFLGQTDGHAEELFQQRYKLAANIGTQLIDNGVKAVVAAGWAVDDEAALDFAKRFYSALFEGYAFGEAVRLAREEIYQKHGQTNTWGAYQCYGDPFFRLTDRDKQTGPKHGYVLSKQAEIDLDNLLSDLETREPGDEDMQWALDRLQPIGAEVDKLGLRNQAITEKEAFVYIELNMAEKAVERFEQLQEFDDATYSFMAIERYYKLRAEKLYRLAGTHQLSNEDLTAEFDGVLRGLQGLLSIKPTAERNSLLGSSYKKKASLVPIKDEAGKVDKKQLAIAVEDLRTSAKYYYQAYQQSADGDAIYPFVNWVALQCLLVNAGDHSWGQDAAEPLRTTAAIQQKIAFFEQSLVKWGHAGEYFDLVRPANMKFCRWLLQFTSKDLPAIDSNEVVEAYKSVWSEDATTAQKQAELLHVKVLQQIASQTGKDKKQVIAHALESVMGLLQGLI